MQTGGKNFIEEKKAINFSSRFFFAFFPPVSALLSPPLCDIEVKLILILVRFSKILFYPVDCKPFNFKKENKQSMALTLLPTPVRKRAELFLAGLPQSQQVDREQKCSSITGPNRHGDYNYLGGNFSSSI